jgi:hypothetical protein
MTGITSSQATLLGRIVEAAADRTIRITAFFEGMPSSYVVLSPERADGVLTFETADGDTMRIREDALIGIREREV